MNDPSGFRPDLGTGYGGDAGMTAEQVAYSYSTMSKTNKYNYEKREAAKKKQQEEDAKVKINTKKAIKKGAGISVITSALGAVPNTLALAANRGVRRGALGYTIPIIGADAARVVGGGISVAFTGVCIWDDFHSGYSSDEAAGRSAIDFVVSASLTAFAIMGPVGWIGLAGIGVATTIVSEIGKNYIYRRNY